MNGYQIIKRVKKLMERVSLNLKEYSGLGKSRNPEIAKTTNFKNDIFQELRGKQSQPEMNGVDLPKYLFI